MKLAILGTRGIPANYGGFETFAEELSVRMAARGHDVTVYGRSNNIVYKGREYKGVKLVILPTIGTKHLDTVVHTFLSVVHAIPQRFDAALICNAANAIFAAIPRGTGTPVALNVDGIERKRRKWGFAGRTYYRVSEYLATLIPNVIVTDAAVIREYYQKEYGVSSTMIAYGAECSRQPTTEIQQQLGVKSREYILYVSRLEPENNAHLVIEAFKKVRTAYRLLVVGDAPYAEQYINNLKAQARGDKRIIFTGFVFGQDYRALQQNAYCYVHATEVGGTHPALLEAMGYGNCVLTLATPENIEVVGDAGVPYADEFDLAEKLQRVLRDGSLVQAYRHRAQLRIRSHYDWDRVVDQYEALFARMCGKPIAIEQRRAVDSEVLQTTTKS